MKLTSNVTPPEKGAYLQARRAVHRRPMDPGMKKWEPGLKWVSSPLAETIANFDSSLTTDRVTNQSDGDPLVTCSARQDRLSVSRG